MVGQGMCRWSLVHGRVDGDVVLLCPRIMADLELTVEEV